jgi:hypothetical protein
MRRLRVKSISRERERERERVFPVPPTFLTLPFSPVLPLPHLLVVLRR